MSCSHGVDRAWCSICWPSVVEYDQAQANRQAQYAQQAQQLAGGHMRFARHQGEAVLQMAVQQAMISGQGSVRVGPDLVIGDADLETARKRITDLEALAEQWRGSYAAADILRDQAIAARREVEAKDEARETLYGAVRNERDDLLRENAVLRRKLEATERKAAKR